MRLALLLLALAAPGAQAEVYKWIDAAGRVTYSDKPPADSARQSRPVREQLSVVSSDPYIATAAAAMQERAAKRAESEERDWQRRREAMLVQHRQAATAGDEPDYFTEFYPVYAVPTHVRRQAYRDRMLLQYYPVATPRSQASNRSSSTSSTRR